MFDSKEIVSRAMGRADEIKENKRRLRKRIETSVVVCGICAVIVLAITLSPMGGTPSDIQITDGSIPMAELLLPDDAAKPYSGEQHGNEPGYMMPGYDRVVIQAGETNVKMALINPERNPYSLTFEIRLAETGEQLYISGLVEKGKYIENIDIAEPLPQGIHKATMTIRVYDPDTLAEKSASTMTFEILAE